MIRLTRGTPLCQWYKTASRETPLSVKIKTLLKANYISVFSFPAYFSKKVLKNFVIYALQAVMRQNNSSLQSADRNKRKLGCKMSTSNKGYFSQSGRLSSPRLFWWGSNQLQKFKNWHQFFVTIVVTIWVIGELGVICLINYNVNPRAATKIPWLIHVTLKFSNFALTYFWLNVTFLQKSNKHFVKMF